MQGCGHTNKIKTSTQVTTNADSLHREELARVKKEEIEKKRKELASKKSAIKIKFQPPVKKDSTANKDTSPTDLVIIQEKGKLKFHSNKPLKEIEVNEEQLKTLTDTEKIVKTDSSGEKKVDSTHLSKQEKIVTKEKDSASNLWLLLIPILLIVYGTGVYFKRSWKSWLA